MKTQREMGRGDIMIRMSQSIVDCNSSPIVVNIAEWLSRFIGRYSIGERINETDAVIYAYSDNSDDIQELGKYARENKLLTIRSVSMKGVTAIEKC